MENFRGFRKAVVPLNDVNFLVGENSTGKTSFLGLANRLQTDNFWLTGDLYSEEFALDTFDEAVSRASDNRLTFRCGLIQGPPQIEDAFRSGNLFLLEYKSANGAPVLSQYASRVGNTLIRIRYLPKSVRIKIGTSSDRDSNFPTLESEFFSFVDDLFCDKTGFSILHRSDEPTSRYPLFWALMSARPLISDEKVVKHLQGPPPVDGSPIWIAPIRSKPRRTYDEHFKPYSPEGEHTPYVIRQKSIGEHRSRKFLKALEAFGCESGLFSKVAVRSFGKGKSSPFELIVSLRNTSFRLGEVGYGVSQALPIVVEIIARQKRSLLLIQQPEVHLHPKAQASMGDLIYESARLDNKRFLIETHSDFTIDRFRMNFRKTDKKIPSAQVLFFVREKGENIVHKLEIGNRGQYPPDQPAAFREFFVNESIKLLGL